MNLSLKCALCVLLHIYRCVIYKVFEKLALEVYFGF